MAFKPGESVMHHKDTVCLFPLFATCIFEGSFPLGCCWYPGEHFAFVEPRPSKSSRCLWSHHHSFCSGIDDSELCFLWYSVFCLFACFLQGCCSSFPVCLFFFPDCIGAKCFFPHCIFLKLHHKVTSVCGLVPLSQTSQGVPGIWDGRFPSSMEGSQIFLRGSECASGVLWAQIMGDLHISSLTPCLSQDMKLSPSPRINPSVQLKLVLQERRLIPKWRCLVFHQVPKRKCLLSVQMPDGILLVLTGLEGIV